MTTLKRGDRIRLTKTMMDDYDDIDKGTTGTVLYVYENGKQVDVDWDNGRALLLLPDVDEFEVIGRDPKFDGDEQ